MSEPTLPPPSGDDTMRPRRAKRAGPNTSLLFTVLILSLAANAFIGGIVVGGWLRGGGAGAEAPEPSVAQTAQTPAAQAPVSQTPATPPAAAPDQPAPAQPAPLKPTPAPVKPVPAPPTVETPDREEAAEVLQSLGRDNNLRQFRRVLTPPARRVLRRNVRRRWPELRALIGEAVTVRRGSMRALRQEPFDPQALDDAFRATRESNAAVTALVHEIVLDTLDELSPEERARIVENLDRQIDERISGPRERRRGWRLRDRGEPY